MLLWVAITILKRCICHHLAVSFQKIFVWGIPLIPFYSIDPFLLIYFLVQSNHVCGTPPWVCALMQYSQIQKQPPEVFRKRRYSWNFSKFIGKHLCWSVFFNKAAGFRPETVFKKTPAHVFCCAFSEIFKNTYFVEHLPNGCSLKYEREFELTFQSFIVKNCVKNIYLF